MRIRGLLLPGALLAVVALGLTGCGYETADAGSQAVHALNHTDTPAPDPAQALVVPKPEPGEVLRLLYTAPQPVQPLTASAPQSETGYVLQTACTAVNGETTLTIELTDAENPSSIILTDIIPCNGTAQIDDAIGAGLPAANVLLTFTRGLDDVTAAYSILTPAPS